MKKTAIALAVALAGFATVAQAARWIILGTLVLKWVGLTTTTLVSTTSMLQATTLILTSWAQVPMLVIRLTSMLASNSATTGWVV